MKNITISSKKTDYSLEKCNHQNQCYPFAWLQWAWFKLSFLCEFLTIKDEKNERIRLTDIKHAVNVGDGQWTN